MRLERPILVLAALLLGGSSDAFQLRRSDEGKVLIWGKSALQVQVDTSVVSALGGAADAVRAGFLTWTAAGVPQQLEHESAKSLELATDGVNAVLWQSSAWKYGKEVVAMTVSSYKRSTGIVTETDIVLNARDHSWKLDPAPGSSDYDVQNVVAHEAGHFFGLGHSDRPEATMYPTTPGGETNKRSLSADDRAGIAALIEEINRRRGSQPSKSDDPGELGQSVETQSIELPERQGIGCSVSGAGGGLALVWPTLLLALIGLARRERRGVRAALLVLATLLTPTTSQATVVRRLSLAQMHKAAATVVQGVVVSRRSYVDPDSRMVMTDYTIRVTRCYKAPAACQAAVTLHTLGGVAGDRGVQVEGMPRLEVKQRVILFGRGAGTRLVPVGLSLGVFRLARGQAERDLRGLSLIEPNAGGHRVRGAVERIGIPTLEAELSRLCSTPAPGAQ